MPEFITRRTLSAASAGLAAGLAGVARASVAPTAPMPTPSASPILTISGRIGRHNQQGAAVFDRPMLHALGLTSFTTSTPWYDRPVRFDGVLMTTLMQAVEASGETVTALALNDYSTDIPVSDFARHGTLLAMLRNGETMRVSDKGPLFIVYPFDSKPELRSRVFYSRSAWSVAQLTVR